MLSGETSGIGLRVGPLGHSSDEHGSTEARLRRAVPTRISTTRPLMIQRFTDPLASMTTFQAPGASGWWGAKHGCYRSSCSRPHRGLDIYAGQGTDIRATEDGAITHGTNPGGYGDYVWLRNGAGNYSRYAHLGSREPAGNYSEGDKIGEIGISGNSNAARPHLHFGYYVGGHTEGSHDVDPETNLADLTQPTQVRSAAGTTTNINRSDPEPCTPCAT